MENIKSGDRVLLVWNNSGENEINDIVNEILNITNIPPILENSAMITEGMCLNLN